MQQSNYATLLTELQTMPEQDIARQLKGFSPSLYTFELNYKEFRTCIQSLTTDPQLQHLYLARNKDQLDMAMVEIMRRLHNFVAAVKSLVDHTRRLHRKLNNGEKGFPDYEEHKRRVFIADPLIQFVQELREFCQHYRLPDIALTLTVTQSNPRSVQKVCLLKTDLSSFEGWGAQAKKYLAASEEQLDILAVVTTYRNKVAEFYAWFNRREQEIFAPELKRIADKTAEYVSWRIETEIDAHLSGKGAITQKEDIFRGAFTAQDYAKIEKTPQDTLERAEQVIRLLEANLSVSDQLKMKIAALYLGSEPQPSKEA